MAWSGVIGHPVHAGETHVAPQAQILPPVSYHLAFICAPQGNDPHTAVVTPLAQGESVGPEGDQFRKGHVTQCDEYSEKSRVTGGVTSGTHFLPPKRKPQSVYRKCFYQQVTEHPLPPHTLTSNGLR